jgi:hypothetical protein
MATKLKVFAVWLIVPYFTVYVAIPGILFAVRRDPGFFAISYWQHQTLGIAYCAIPACLGTLLLWTVPIQRRATGISLGIILALVIPILIAWIQFTYAGGFEEAANVTVGTALLLIPSAIAGAMAALYVLGSIYCQRASPKQSRPFRVKQRMLDDVIV